ncbi:MAG: hypothetical protein AAFZ10_02020 [Pseudomonadota bacterium]
MIAPTRSRTVMGEPGDVFSMTVHIGSFAAALKGYHADHVTDGVFHAD